MKTLIHATTLACLSAPLLAQVPCQADFDGNVFQNNVSMGGPNFTNCFKTVAKTTLVVLAVEVFTGERVGTSTVGIWSHDAATDRPKAELARGSWTVDIQNRWQGANLSKPVVLAKDEVFWVSWIPVDGSQASVENTGRTLPGIQPYVWSRTNSAPWNGPYQDHQWKFRLWCTPLSNPGVKTIGSSCPDGFNNSGAWNANSTPSVGNSGFGFAGTGLPPSAPALVFIGTDKSFISVDLTAAGARGCFLHTDVLLQIPLQTSAGTPSKSDGAVALPAPIPNDANLKGFYLRTQLAVADPNAQRPLAAVFTNGLEIVIQ